MCGICGIARLDGSSAALHRDELEAMAQTMVHRGPDSAGLVIEGPVGLAARRLSIIDLEHGDQPLTNEEGDVVVVQNGEIVNFRQLRAELESAGHRFRTDGDTEVLAHLYEQHGLDFAERLRGMFAIAIWDVRRRRLVLARDPFGIKPLVHWSGPETLAFASDLRGLRRAPGFAAEIDPEAVDAYLTFNSVPGPMTILRGARKLPAGHLLVWEPGSPPRTSRFSRPAPAARDALRDEDEAVLAAELLERLRGSVRAHLVADVPVGILLSGGVDSGTLAALASEASRDPVATFSIGFAEQSFNELGRAREVARRYGTNHMSSCSSPMRSSCCPGSSPRSTSRSAIPRPSRPSWSRSSPRARSRSCSPARGPTRCSAATTPMSPTGWALDAQAGRNRPAARGAPAQFEPQGESGVQGQAVRPRR